ncbi:hypothetical protein AB1Y20_000761 [Prymnesium parvum]|uniref:MIR domain-containing protein n=1 Tax=Prymnesium parvum TaxID=97485 RepID=A0AB34K5R9_PRYPA
MNKQTYEQLIGRELRYGMVIQLQHETSQKYLCVTKQASEVNKEGRRVILDREAGEDAWFRLMPKLRVHSEGVRVHEGDPVLLEHVNTNLCLRVEAGKDTFLLPDGRHELLATPSGTALKMLQYRSYSDAMQAKRTLLSGKPMRLLHKQADGTLGSQLNLTGAESRVYLNTDKHVANVSSNTVWAIEKKSSPFDGSACTWDEVYRLRHMGSGLLLAVSPPKPGSIRASTQGFGGSSVDTIGELEGKVSLTNDGDDDNTLFWLQPQYSTEGAIPIDAFFRIRHVNTDFFLHVQMEESSAAEAEAETSLSTMASSAEQKAPKDESSNPFAQLAGLMNSELFAKVGSVEPEEEDDMLRGVSATARMHDVDVFGMSVVEEEQKQDMVQVLSNISAFIKYFLQFTKSPLPEKDEVDFDAVTSVLSDLIIFVTDDDIYDPKLREGIPFRKRQMLLREQFVLDFAIKCVALPFSTRLFSSADLDTASKRSRPPASDLHYMGCLAMRLARHIIRDSSSNKEHALKYVDQLQSMMGYNMKVADVVTEIFADNESVDLVRESSIHLFVNLIRTAGRKPQYVDFLNVLCKCNGRAVRTNQTRVAKALVGQAPELLLKLRVVDGVVKVSGDPEYFGALTAGQKRPSLQGQTEMPIGEWLQSAPSDDVKYFEHCIALFSSMVEGRNLVTTQLIKQQMPYDMVLKVVTDSSIYNDPKFVSVCAGFVGLIRRLYIDNEPHELMARLKTVRIWKNVQTAAESMQLSTRLTMKVDTDFDQFDELEHFCISHISKFVVQDARKVGQNQMVIELLKVLFDLISYGFVTSNELIPMMPVFLALLDGRDDTVSDLEDKKERYNVKKNSQVDTLVLMECKLVVCEILQLVGTVQLDVRLSQLLNVYRQEFEAGIEICAPNDDDDENADEQGGSACCKAIVDCLEAAGFIEDVATGGYARLHDSSSPISKEQIKKIRIAKFQELESILKLDASQEELQQLAAKPGMLLAEGAREAAIVFAPKLVPVLTDIVRYKHTELVDAALTLLYQYSYQASNLVEAGLQTQLLVKETMVERYQAFDALLRLLGRYSSRRRLMDDETYTVAYILGQLTTQCYEETSENEPVAKSIAMTMRTKTDHTAGMYLMLLGKCSLSWGSKNIYLTHRGLYGGTEGRGIFPKDKLQIFGKMYSVVSVKSDGVSVELNAPVDQPSFMVQGEAHSKAKLAKRTSSFRASVGDEASDVWVFLECRSPQANMDMQLLLKNMGAHEHALQLLQLPIGRRESFEDYHARAVLSAAYRVLKAMCTGSPLMQSELVNNVPLFLEHVECNLVSHDISPTGLINTIFQDNRSVCAQVQEETVRLFVKMAALEQAPRFMRFLRMVVAPNGRTIERNATLVLQLLTEQDDAMLLFSGKEGIKQRASLIEKNDAENNPRGKLVYHMELLELFANCASGSEVSHKASLRIIFPLHEITQHARIPDLPLHLRASYLAILDFAWLDTVRVIPSVALSMSLHATLEDLARMTCSFAKEYASPESISNFELDSPEAEEAYFVCTSAVKTLNLFLKIHYKPSCPESVTAAYSELAEVMLDFLSEAVQQPQVMPPDELSNLCETLHAKSFLEVPPPAVPEKASLLPSTAGLAVSEVNAEKHPQATIAEFVGIYSKLSGASKEFDEIVKIFTVGIESKDDIKNATNQRRWGMLKTQAEEPEGMRLLRILVQQIIGSRILPSSPDTLTTHTRKLTISSVKVLIAILDNCGENFDLLELRQDMLNEMGGAKVALMLASCADDDLYKAGLDFAIMLLKRGNHKVQQTMLELLTAVGASAQEEIAAFDGSSGSLVLSMRQRLRLALKEIRERKMHGEIQLEKRKALMDAGDGLSAGTRVALMREAELPFPERAFAVDTLELARLLCEGHNRRMQDFLHEQPSQNTSIDIWAATVELLMHLDAELDSENVFILEKCLDALVEGTQGNISQVVISTLLDTKLFDTLDRLFDPKREIGSIVEGKHCPLSDAKICGVHLLATKLVQSECEGADHRAEDRMLQVLQLEHLSALSQRYYEKWRAAASRLPKVAILQTAAAKRERAAAKEEIEMFNQAGREMYMLLQHIEEYEEGGLDKDIWGKLSDEAIQYYNRQHGRVEIVNQLGLLERVHFWIPDFCLLLSDESKQELLYTVDRQTPGRQITEFFLKRDEFYHDLKHQGWLMTFPAWRALIAKKQLATNNQFALAITQNIVIIIGNSSLKDAVINESTPLWARNLFEGAFSHGNFFLGVCQCLSCVVVFVLYGFHQFPNEQYKNWKAHTGYTFREALAKARAGEPYWIIQVLYRTPLYLLTNRQLSFYTFLFIASILGLTVDPLWFSVHLLDIVNKSRELQDVFKAVTTNGSSIMLTAILGSIIVYIYTIVAFRLFRSDMVLDNYPDEDIDLCDDLLVCFLNTFNEGLRAGDVGAIIDPASPGDSSYAVKLIFELSYYVFVITIILNLVFGIIIDTFAQLRESNAFIKDQTENLCFICGIDRFTFDNKGEGFEHHVKKDHNMWAYMFLMIYLRDKDPTEYNGWEQYLAKKIADDETSFFPVKKALVLQALQEQEEAHEVAKEQRVVTMAEQVAELIPQIELLQKGLNSKDKTAESLTVLEGKLDKIARSVEAFAPPVVEAESVRLAR